MSAILQCLRAIPHKERLTALCGVALDVLQGIISGFAGTDLYNIFYIINEDLAVADLAGVQNLLDCIDNLLRRKDCTWAPT